MSSEFDEIEVMIAFDGDRVGESIESFLANCDLAGVRKFSQAVTKYFEDLKMQFEELGATIYLTGGDSLLVGLPRSRFDHTLLQALPSGPCTISIGIGWNSRTVLMALKTAKALGRSQTFSLLDDQGKGELEREI